MKKILITIILLLPTISYAKSCYKTQTCEKHYQERFCNDLKGKQEVRIEGGRIDCLTKKYAIEIDFSKKWAECIGQALYYGNYTNKKPACAIIGNEKEIIEATKKIKIATPRLKVYHIKRK